MIPDWLWQNVVGSGAWKVVSSATAVVIAYLKQKQVKWFPVLFYTFASFVFVAVLFYVLYGRPLLSTEPPDTTPENVEQNIRTWSDTFGYSVRTIEQPRNSENYFQLVITDHGGLSVEVTRPHRVGREKYLVFRSKVFVPPETEKKFSAFSDDQNAELVDELYLEGAKLRLAAFGVDSNPRLKSVDITRVAGINRNLNEASFNEYFAEMSSDVIVMQQTINLAVRRFAQTRKPS